MPSQLIINSVIHSVTWDGGSLTVKFKTGSRYRYYHVPVDHYYKICVSKKPGRYYLDNIKGKFEAVKLNPNQQ